MQSRFAFMLCVSVVVVSFFLTSELSGVVSYCHKVKTQNLISNKCKIMFPEFTQFTKLNINDCELNDV